MDSISAETVRTVLFVAGALVGAIWVVADERPDSFGAFVLFFLMGAFIGAVGGVVVYGALYALPLLIPIGLLYGLYRLIGVSAAAFHSVRERRSQRRVPVKSVSPVIEATQRVSITAPGRNLADPTNGTKWRKSSNKRQKRTHSSPTPFTESARDDVAEETAAVSVAPRDYSQSMTVSENAASTTSAHEDDDAATSGSDEPSSFTELTVPSSAMAARLSEPVLSAGTVSIRDDMPAALPSALNDPQPILSVDQHPPSAAADPRVVRRVFLSYRRNDNPTIVGRFHDRLIVKFGENNVFRDIDSIPYGADFVQYLDATIRMSDLVFVVVGPRWFAGPPGEWRIDSPKDFVRQEIASALRYGVPVVPVLVAGADMPAADQLPPDIAAFATRHAAVLRDDPDFNTDVARLLARLVI